MSLEWFMDVSFFLLVFAVVDMAMSLLADFIHPLSRIEKFVSDLNRLRTKMSSTEYQMMKEENNGTNDDWKTEWSVC